MQIRVNKDKVFNNDKQVYPKNLIAHSDGPEACCALAGSSVNDLNPDVLFANVSEADEFI